MIQNVSFPRAFASCMPFVGPVIGLWNYLEVQKDLESDELLLQDNLIEGVGRFVEDFIRTLNGNQLARASGLIDREPARINPFMEEGLREIRETVNQTRKEPILAFQKKVRVYAVCSIVGNLISVIAVVRLIALKVLSPMAGAFIATGLIVFSAFLGFHFYQDAKKIKESLRSDFAR